MITKILHTSFVSEGARLTSSADSSSIARSFKPDLTRETLSGAPEVDVVSGTAEPTLSRPPVLSERPCRTAGTLGVALSGGELARLTERTL